MNFEIQRGDRSSPYALSFYLRDGVRYVVAGYLRGDLFYRTVIVAGVSDGGSETELVDVLIDWFRTVSVDDEVQMPLTISSDGTVGGVQQFLSNVGEALGRPILHLTFVDDHWLLETLRRAYGDSDTPWCLLEKLRIAAGGSCRNDLLHTLPILSKVGIFCVSICDLSVYVCVFFRRKYLC